YADGGVGYISVNINVERDEHGKIFRYYGANQDITERKLTEQRTQERETLLRTIIDSTPDWIFVTDREHRYQLANAAYAKSVNMSPDEVLGKTALDLNIPEEIVLGNAEKGIVGFWPDDDEVFANGKMKVVDVEPTVIEGEERFINTIKAPLKDANGEVTAVVGFVQDITERIHAERQIRERETLLRTIIDSTPDWIFVKDREHRYRLVNQGYANSFNMAPDDFIGKNDLEIGFPEEIVKGDPENGIVGFWPDDNEVMAKGEMKVIDVEPGEVNGQEVVLSTIKSPLRDADGEVTAVVGFVHDITNRVKIEGALARQARELQIVAELATTVTTTLDQEKLLQEVVDLARERFDFYHTQIYLLDATRERLILAFGAGDVGHKLVAQKHQIGLNASQSLVAEAARSGVAVVVNNVRSNPGWLANKLLPETQAEMAVPMMVGDRVIGVLDVQSGQMDRFTEQDVQIQTTLAAQVSIALENARSFEQAQTAVSEMNALTRRLTREGWDDYFEHASEKSVRFLFDSTTINMATLATDAPDIFDAPLVQPIEVRGVTIGKIAAVPAENDPAVEEVVESVMHQLAAHIENLRLTEQVQTSLAQTEALYTGSERIVLSATEADILESLIYSTELRKLDRANIFLFNQPVEDGVARDVTAVAVWQNKGVPRTIEVGAHFTVDQVPFLSQISPEQPIMVLNIDEDPRINTATRQILQKYEMSSFMLFPMVVGSQWLGLVSGESNNPVHFNEVQRRQTSSLISQASVVLQTTLLFRQEQARARREQLLREITAKVRSSVDVDTVMRTAVTEIGRTLGRRAFIELGQDQPGNGPKRNGAT
ncbi:MAG: PAS domain-containing protein, partial [Candidatus Promineifilaceae bacterium]